MNLIFLSTASSPTYSASIRFWCCLRKKEQRDAKITRLSKFFFLLSLYFLDTYRLRTPNDIASQKMGKKKELVFLAAFSPPSKVSHPLKSAKTEQAPASSEPRTAGQTIMENPLEFLIVSAAFIASVLVIIFTGKD